MEEKKKRNRGNVFLIGLFLAMIFGWTLFGILKPAEAKSERENRYLAQCPDFSLDEFFRGKFSPAYETYVTDQFPLRDAWVRVKCLSDRGLGFRETNGVYLGKDGTLLQKNNEEVYETELAKKNVAALEKFAAELEGKVRLRVMLVPTAQTIRKEQLPRFAVPYPEEKWIEAISLPSQVAVDGVEPLRALEEESPGATFYGTDHHWTTEGAYAGYRAWAKSMGFLPIEPEEFQQEVLSTEFYGTLESKVNLPVKPDTITGWMLKGATYRMQVDESGVWTQEMYSRKFLTEKDQYSVFLDGNHAIREIHTQGGQEGTLLLLHDSYAHCFGLFAANHYETTYMIDLRYYNRRISEFLADHSVDDVLVLYNSAGFAQEKTLYRIGE